MTHTTRKPAPRGNEERAEQSPSAASVTSSVFHIDSERVARRRRLERDAERTKASRQLNALIDEMHPRPEREPCTFGMNPEQRRAYARDLMNGNPPFQAWEVQIVLARPEVAA